VSLPLNWPGSLDSFASPSPTQETDDPGFELDLVVTRIHTLLMALEAKLGTGSSTPVSGQVLRSAATGAATYGLLGDANIAAVGAANIDPGKLLASGTPQRVLATGSSAPAAWQQVATAMLAPNAVSQIAYGTPTAGQVYGGGGASVAMTMSATCSNVSGGGTTLVLCSGVWQHSVAGTTVYSIIAQNGSGVGLEASATIPIANGYAAFATIALTATTASTTYTYTPYWRCPSNTMALVAGAICAVEFKR